MSFFNKRYFTVIIETRAPSPPTPYVSISYMYPTGGGQNQGNCEVGCENNWNFGGGGIYGGEVLEEEIINELTGKAKCVYDKLLKSGIRNPHNLITQLFIEFENGNIGNNDLTFKMVTNLPNSIGEKTVLD